METATLDVGCSAPNVKTANGGTCPDKCAAVNVTAPGNCKLAADWKPQYAAACNPINMVVTVGSTTMYTGTTGTTAAPDKCSMAYAKDGAACLAAVSSFSCSYGCQKCTDASAPIKLCKKVCDGLKAMCPTVVADCGAASPFSDALCAAADTDCADTMIEGTVAAAPTTSTPATSAPAGGSTGATTKPVVEGDCNQTTCTACATAKCTWCATGMTSETQTNTNCIAANATCTSTQTAYNETAKCVYDQNNACEKLTTCATCAADAKCSWCDTGAAAGGLVSTGSCNRGTTCKTGITPTKATECSASTFAVAFFAVFGAILAAL